MEIVPGRGGAVTLTQPLLNLQSVHSAGPGFSISLPVFLPYQLLAPILPVISSYFTCKQPQVWYKYETVSLNEMMFHVKIQHK